MKSRKHLFIYLFFLLCYKKRSVFDVLIHSRKRQLAFFCTPANLDKKCWLRLSFLGERKPTDKATLRVKLFTRHTDTQETGCLSPHSLRGFFFTVNSAHHQGRYKHWTPVLSVRLFCVLLSVSLSNPIYLPDYQCTYLPYMIKFGHTNIK